MRVLSSKMFASFGQTVKINSTKTKSTGTQFLVKIDTIEELNNFYWNMVEEIF